MTPHRPPTSHCSESNSNPQHTCYGQDLTQVGFGSVLRTSRRPLPQVNGKWRVGHTGDPQTLSAPAASWTPIGKCIPEWQPYDLAFKLLSKRSSQPGPCQPVASG